MNKKYLCLLIIILVLLSTAETRRRGRRSGGGGMNRNMADPLKSAGSGIAQGIK